MLKSHFQLKVKDQYQISNYPCPFSVFWEDDGIEPIPHAELWAAVPLELVSISTLDPKLFEPLGDDETESAIAEAIDCGDPTLLPDPEDSEDWAVRQQIIEILEGKVPEWKFLGLHVDPIGISLVIIHRDPLPDGQPLLRDYLLPTIRSHTLTVRTADGRLCTYLQKADPEVDDTQICLVKGNITGDCELCFISELPGSPGTVLVDITKYH